MSESTASTAVRPSSWTVRDTPVGPLLLAATGEGLVNVVFHADQAKTDRALTRLAALLGAPPARGTPLRPPRTRLPPPAPGRTPPSPAGAC